MVDSRRVVVEQWIERHREIFGAFLDAWCVVDRDNRLVDFNDAFTDFSGLTHRKLLKLGNVCEILKFAECPDQCPSRVIMTTGRPLRLDEVRAHVGSSAVNLIVAGVPVLADTGTPEGALLLIRNVSAEAQLQEKYVRTRSQSIVDGLTELYNKTYLEKRLQLMAKTFIRDQQPFSVVLIDLDHFKQINDTYGHPAGDFVLRTFAKVLKLASRDTDVIGRFGGEEFIALLPKCVPDGARIFGARLKQRLAAVPIEWQTQRLAVTASMGGATISAEFCDQHGADPKAVADALVALADQALYRAKHAGRDRMCLAAD